jgi:hypothetical protein
MNCVSPGPLVAPRAFFFFILALTSVCVASGSGEPEAAKLLW